MQDLVIPVSISYFMYTNYMKYMGIDYGTKRIGIALSDDGGTIAFPRVVIQNTSTLFTELINIIKSESVQEVVVGKSMDQQGNRNIVMEDIDAFVEELERLTKVKVYMEDERFTSHFLKSFDFTKSIEKPISRDRNKKQVGNIDAQAAASILQRFLDKNN